MQPITSTSTDSAKNDEFLVQLLQQYPAYFDSVLAHKKDWNVQVIYTQVNRNASGKPQLNHYYFNVNPQQYFYPASTVKFPVALLALQKLNELNNPGVNKNTAMITGVATASQTPVYNDPTSPDGHPSIAQYIKKVLLVSDNDAFNRLYEFSGQDYINSSLHKMGYGDAQILHRLQIMLPEKENRQTNPIDFYSGDSLIYHQPAQNNTAVYEKRTDTMGNGYYTGGVLINEPMNFSKKNRMALEDLHRILISLVFPEAVPPRQRFNITDDDRRFVLKHMSELPAESSNPPYNADTAQWWPAYCKFLMMGSENKAWPQGIRIFNKTGDAYGQMVDIAYVADYDKGVEFFLSAVIYCNSDGILNDDKYDYSTIGLPFMKHLGQVIYDYELKRKKIYPPDLSGLRFTYDGN
ncbi:MAG: serine hydrolase [Bacteroidetes bacterium]|nr:serine hydrolase [Bacteroidota bacterium]